MKKTSENPAAYHDLIWEAVWSKALKKANGSKSAAMKDLMKHTDLSESTIRRYVNGEDRKWRDDTRTIMFGYLEVKGLQEFIKRIDEQKDTPRAVAAAVDDTADITAPVQDGGIRYNIPLRPDYFVGRSEKLKEIHDSLLNATNRNNIVLVSGVGGMGKTTLMQEYLYQDYCDKYFDRIITISVNKDLETAFIDGADEALQIGIRGLGLQDEALDAVVKKMRTYEGRNLFVVDNINEYDYDDLRKMKVAFNKTGWKFLITTRTAPRGFTLVTTDELEEDAAVLLFAHHYIPDDTENRDPLAISTFIDKYKLRGPIKALLTHILRHTLLIELLAKVGKVKDIGVDTLLEHLKEQDFKNPQLDRVIDTGSHADNTFRQQLNMAMLSEYLLSLFDTQYLLEKTGNDTKDLGNKAKVEMLHFFSVLPYKDMIIADLKKLWNVMPAEEIAFENRLDELMQIGWLQGKKNRIKMEHYLQQISYKMHQLVQQVVYDKLHPNMTNCGRLMGHLDVLIEEEIGEPGRRYREYANYMLKKLGKLHGLN